MNYTSSTSNTSTTTMTFYRIMAGEYYLVEEWGHDYSTGQPYKRKVYFKVLHVNEASPSITATAKIKFADGRTGRIVLNGPFLNNARIIPKLKGILVIGE